MCDFDSFLISSAEEVQFVRLELVRVQHGPRKNPLNLGADKLFFTLFNIVRSNVTVLEFYIFSCM